ncbi:DDE-type integrase/transposase/recombinase [Aneurinibacillus sp. Ricciae_BoGa-3]|uniref:DDE-type integrase/transposase/recombinase n=1 Tax=Aneurinibacillus sp. Ricciae_BoGa-3 TaxID=3022697 RepID=UPI0023409111|nr:DDE-type integrase/transposase/recombinase [Aneurinibacillus sp. Ricciae_BoGa-3]WCK55911.1 DDE-type integrase/transposase/recombinase [Aneurinibacillus sp. Ricciae_BoGa-3]
MDDNLRNEIAAFRFGLIAPVVQRRLAPGERYALLREIAGQTYTIPCSEKTKISIRSLERYLQAYESGGFDALKPQIREKRGSLHHLEPTILQRALELRKELPSRSVDQIIRILELEAVIERGVLKSRTLSRYFQENGWNKRDKHRAVTKEFRMFEHDAPNDCWQADTQHTLHLPDPDNPSRRKKAYLIAILDDHSRRIMHAEFFFEERSPRLERCMQKAVLKYGVPHIFYCDNGSVYSAKQFKIICAKLGTKLIHAKPYSPESKGKIEKFFQYVDSSFTGEAKLLVQEGRLKNLQQLNQYLRSWLESYDNRIHRGTGQTPKKRYEAKKEEVRYLDAEKVKECFLWEEERTVRKTAIIELEGSNYDVDSSLRGKKVKIRYNPFDLSLIQVWKDEQRFPDAVPAQLRNQQHSKIPTDSGNDTPPTVVSDYLEKLKKEQEDEKRRELGTPSFVTWKEKKRGEK